MSQAANIQETTSDSESELKAGASEIARFYADRNVLLTGGTGFLGRLLIERILRSCPDVKTLFLLVRPKKEKSPEERFKELFDDVIFDRLRRDEPMFAKKIVLIDGDMAEVGLGLSSEQRKLLLSTHVVIHGAATVRFDEKLRIAANINVRGTQELLSLAKEMVHLKAFVHVSTAYSECVNDTIKEKFYPPPIDSDKLLSLLDILDDASLDHLTPVLLGKWPNTYTFTKAVAEDAIRRNCQSLTQLCIVRPSIIVATSKEPVPGWINNVYGPTGLVVGVGMGLLRTLYCKKNTILDMVPADYVVNNIIVAAWDIAETQNKEVNSADISSAVPRVEDPPIYNVVSSNQRPITIEQFVKNVTECIAIMPNTLCVWYYCIILNAYRWIHYLCIIFLHLIPATTLDGLAWLTGRKPMLWKKYKKIHKFWSALEFFTLNQWRFDNDNALRLWERLSATDRSEFDLDIGGLDWKDYIYRYVRGIRFYLLKDPLDTLPQGQARYAKQKVAHYALITALCGIFSWLMWSVLRFSASRSFWSVIHMISLH